MKENLEIMLKLLQVQKFVPYSKAQIYRLIQSGDFPPPICMGKRRVAWRESDIKAYQQKWGALL